MEISVEISFYPLMEGYEQTIIQFIKALKKETKISVEVNGMSTQVFGDDAIIMPLLHQEMMKSLQEQKGIFVMKVGKGILKLSKPIEDM
jgi:uncharacterized protein YqgV (UPF0045/DUF77 family)